MTGTLTKIFETILNYLNGITTCCALHECLIQCELAILLYICDNFRVIAVVAINENFAW